MGLDFKLSWFITNFFSLFYHIGYLRIKKKRYDSSGETELYIVQWAYVYLDLSPDATNKQTVIHTYQENFP